MYVVTKVRTVSNLVHRPKKTLLIKDNIVKYRKSQNQRKELKRKTKKNPHDFIVHRNNRDQPPLLGSAHSLLPSPLPYPPETSRQRSTPSHTQIAKK